MDKAAATSAHVFFDGQNLFHAVKEAWGYTAPNYDVESLSHVVCQRLGWTPTEIRFYTGVPTADYSAKWRAFWDAKTARMGRRGIAVFRRDLRVRLCTAYDENGDVVENKIPVEKGVDVRIALDIIRAVMSRACDAILIFSQDQDFSEVSAEVKRIAEAQERFVKLASAYPVGAGTINERGINGTDWFPIDDRTYRSCIDAVDYFPRRL